MAYLEKVHQLIPMYRRHMPTSCPTTAFYIIRENQITREEKPIGSYLHDSYDVHVHGCVRQLFSDFA